MRIVVSGGGTAGHILPTLAAVDALKQRHNNLEVYYIGERGGMEATLAGAAGLRFESIRAGKYRRLPSAGFWKNLRDLDSLRYNLRDSGWAAVGLGQSLRLLRRLRPDVVFVKGGYVGLPVGLAAAMLGIPLVIHESDVTLGLTNKILARWAKKIAVGFPVEGYHWPITKLVFTGNPVREGITKGSVSAGRQRFGFNDRLPVVLIMGGSLGAQAINQVVSPAVAELTMTAQIIHLTGRKEFGAAQQRVDVLKLKYPERYRPVAFLDQEMADAYAMAEVVVSRAGAGSIAELAATAKPVIMIPNRLMAAHQVMNADVLAAAGAAQVVTEAQLTPQLLAAKIAALLDDSTKRQQLSTAIHHFYTPDAPDRLAELIFKTAGKAS